MSCPHTARHHLILTVRRDGCHSCHLCRIHSANAGDVWDRSILEMKFQPLLLPCFSFFKYSGIRLPRHPNKYILPCDGKFIQDIILHFCHIRYIGRKIAKFLVNYCKYFEIRNFFFPKTRFHLILSYAGFFLLFFIFSPYPAVVRSLLCDVDIMRMALLRDAAEILTNLPVSLRALSIS